MRRRIACVVAALGLSAAIPLGASAVPVPCPDEIRAVPGGARDAVTNGYDDGTRGEGGGYEPGEILIGLRRGVGAGAVSCLARELDAVLLDGGAGRKGVAGVPGVLRMLLPAGTSVRATARLVASGPAAGLVDWAAPNMLRSEAVDPPPNDPFFPQQWALNPAALTTRFSVRAMQGWAAGIGLDDGVRVAVVDDGIAVHEDLAQTLSVDGSRIVGGELTGSAAIGFEETRRPAGPVQFVLAGNRLCEVEPDAAVAVIQSMFERRTRAMCNDTGPTSTQVLTVRAAGGTFTLATPAGDGALDLPPDTGPLNWNAYEDEIRTALHAETGFGAIPERDIHVNAMAASDACGPPDCQAWSITTRGPARIEITPNGSRLQAPAGGTASATVTQSQMQVTEVMRGLPAGIRRAVSIDTRIAGEAPIGVKSGRARLVNADLTPVLGMPTASHAGKLWPVDGADSGDHGLAVAGLLAADTNNGIGVAGTAGPSAGRPYVSLSGILALGAQGSGDAAIADAIWYSVHRLKAHVVNMSLGGPLSGGSPVLADPRREDPAEATLTHRAMGNVPRGSQTLFVIAAGNEAGNLASVAERERQPYRGRRVDAADCRPKGMGITARPAWPGGTPRDKGGTDSFLQMPDGTYDRGNILCVGAIGSNGQVSDFSNWGVGIVDVAAPGSRLSILQPAPGAPRTPSTSVGIGDGTSYSAPVVAGIAALVFRQNPSAPPWLVKCAILSAATSRPIAKADRTQLPFIGYATGDAPANIQGGRAFTVHGVPLAAEAISAASSLLSRIQRARESANSGQAGRVRYPSCVQKRRYFLGLFGGGWRDTPVRTR